MILSVIVAMGDDRSIGRGGDLAFHISADLKHFKQITMGHPVIMGRKTFESLPKGALPGRRNIVITRNAAFSAPNVETVGSLDDALKLVADNDEAFIIGGGTVYAQAFPMAERLYLTRIHASLPEADTFFPEVDEALWQPLDAPVTALDEKSGLNYTFINLERKK